MHPLASLSGDVKKKLGEYSLAHFRSDFEESEYGKSYFTSESDDEDVDFGAWIGTLDRFLLYGKTQGGGRVLDAALRAQDIFTQEEKDVVEEWRDKAFESVFEIRGIHTTHLELYDVVAEALLAAYSNTEIPVAEVLGNNARIGYFLHTNLAPVRGVWFLSGVQTPLPPNARRMIYDSYAKALSVPAMYRNNPDKLARAFAMQKTHYDEFVQMFGADEVLARGVEVPCILAKFYGEQMRRKGLSDEEISKRGLSEAALRDTFPKEILDADDVGIVVDEKEGLHQMLEYGKFMAAFSEPRPTAEDVQAVAGYLDDETSPAFVFHRALERHPGNYVRVMNAVLALFNQPARLADDYDAMMDICKPDWRDVYPSVHPMNEFFAKESYEDRGTERNDPCPCGSGKKFKKCHG